MLRGNPDDTRELAALLGVNYRKDASGQFAHSNLITVLNGAGEIVFQQPGLNLPPEDVIESLKGLRSK
jgi:protein SCO1/2